MNMFSSRRLVYKINFVLKIHCLLSIVHHPNFFPGKLLLFGEHTVLKGSEALAIPLWQLGGTWQCTKNEIASVRLSNLVNYLEKQVLLTPALSLNIEQLKQDVFENRFWFDSNVPEGYGAGSSGALIAALYENYVTEKTQDITLLKKQLGIMESFFHGTSSGFDPLVSYIKKPIHIHSGGGMDILENQRKSPLSIFLIDTNLPRKTETFVNIFLEKCKDDYFLEQINNTLIPETDAAIHFFLENKSELFFSTLHSISLFQFRFFTEFIPMTFRDIWLEGLVSSHFRIKLCGAGGGGFLLCFSKDEVTTENILKEKNITFLKIKIDSGKKK